MCMAIKIHFKFVITSSISVLLALIEIIFYGVFLWIEEKNLSVVNK